MVLCGLDRFLLCSVLKVHLVPALLFASISLHAAFATCFLKRPKTQNRPLSFLRGDVDIAPYGGDAEPYPVFYSNLGGFQE